MFGFNTSRPDSDHRYNEEGEWYEEASGPVAEPVDEQPVQYQAVAHVSVTHGIESVNTRQ
ncbi:hypothetical protein DPMN_189394 [Dreissena polymorpha]|uniref:Uncharacterized protein n=1 Tax=Dreissena polymorpha TaxID=45954 RepID=A0A9D4DTG5_DREPO|nr:hypothetical protein DPMN_189394 [Dreissena polymorpha]